MRLATVWVLLCCAALPAQARAPELRLEVGEDDIDLATRTISFMLSSVAASAAIEVFSAEGQLLHSGARHYDDPAPGSRLSIGWPELPAGTDNFRIELTITDDKGNWVDFQVIRFYLEIPHEEVVFATGKWAISEAEREKLKQPLSLLEDAFAKYGELMDVKLYVAGHTDTVGKAADNQPLSEKRARAIARYFIDNGLSGMPIFVRGFGEGALAVKTKDNVAEQRNRRAQYIISSFVPELSGPGSWRRVQ